MKLIVEIEIITPTNLTHCELITELTEELEAATAEPSDLLYGVEVLEIHKEN